MAFKIFIGSSTVTIPYVKALLMELDDQTIGGEKIECLPWMHAFRVGDITIDALLRHSEECDAAVFIVSKDDLIAVHDRAHTNQEEGKKNHYVTRDNVVLELGIFLGRLGRDKVFFVVPADHQDLHLPSDLNGVTWAPYNDQRQNKRIAAIEACELIMQKLSDAQDLPPRPKLLEVFSELQKEVKNFSNTRAIGTFPSYFRNHICELVRKSKSILIASDVLTYGAFTDRKTFELYFEYLQDKDREVSVIVPSAKRIPAYIKRQIPKTEWLEKYKKDKEFRMKLAAFEDLINSDDKITDPEAFYRAVVGYQNRRIKSLQRNAENHKVKVIEKDFDMPMFLWIADNTEAIFSIPIDKTTGSSFEHSFWTRDRDLIMALRATWNRYSKS